MPILSFFLGAIAGALLTIGFAGLYLVRMVDRHVPDGQTVAARTVSAFVSRLVPVLHKNK